MNIRIFNGRYNAIAPLLIHMRFACVFRPAGSVKWDACAQVRPRHNSTAAGKDVCNFIVPFFISEADCDVSEAAWCEFVMEKCDLRQLEF